MIINSPIYQNYSRNKKPPMNSKSILFDEQNSDQCNHDSDLNVSTEILSGIPTHPTTSYGLDHTNRTSSTNRSSIHNSPDRVIRREFNDLEKKQNSPPFRSSDYKLFSNMFIGSMMAQYILIFFAIPFSEVDNRPAASVLSCLFGYLSFLLCVLMIPAGLINVPTRVSFQTSMISCLLKLIDLAANINSVILCLRVKEPMIEYTFDSNRVPVRPLDITLYIQIVSCLLLISSLVTLFFAMVVFFFNLAYFQTKKRYEAQKLPDKESSHMTAQ